MRKFAIALLGLFTLPCAMAQQNAMSDREIILLHDSVAGEETAFRSLVPQGYFPLKLEMKEKYTIVDHDAPDYHIPGLVPIHKFSIEGCLKKTGANQGVCLQVGLNDNQANRQKLRVLKSAVEPADFLVKLEYIKEWEDNGVKYKVLDFRELSKKQVQ